MDALQAFWLYIKDFNLLSVILRLVLSALAGAAIGEERAAHGRAAGLRTHTGTLRFCYSVFLPTRVRYSS